MFFKTKILITVFIAVTLVTKVYAKGGGRGGGRGGGGRSSSGRSSSSGSWSGGWFGGSKSSSGSIKSGSSSGSSGYYSGSSKSGYSSYNKNSGHTYYGQQQNHNYQPHYYRNPPQPDHQIRNHLAAGLAGAFLFSRLGHYNHGYNNHHYERREYHRNQKLEREMNGTYVDPVEKFERIHFVPFYTTHDNESDTSDRAVVVHDQMMAAKENYKYDSDLPVVEKTIDITNYMFNSLRPKDTEIVDISPDPVLTEYRKSTAKSNLNEQTTPPGPEILPLFIHQIADADPYYFNGSFNPHINKLFLVVCSVFLFLRYKDFLI